MQFVWRRAWQGKFSLGFLIPRDMIPRDAPLCVVIMLWTWAVIQSVVEQVISVSVMRVIVANNRTIL